MLDRVDNYLSPKVHHLDLTSKVPWLKDKLKTSRAVGDGDTEEQQRETSDPPPPEVDTPLGTSSELAPLHQATPTSHTPNNSVADTPLQDMIPPPLPDRDYDIAPPPPDLPPRDYPMSPDHSEQNGDPILDNDYYAQIISS